MIDSSSFISALAKSWGVSNLAKSDGVVLFTLSSVHWAGQKIINDFNGIVPHTMDELITIPGVGRKSANVIMLEAFNDPQGIAVDTHAKRLANRIGFSNENEPTKIEKDLCAIIPKEYWKDVNHLFIWHGRSICSSQSPKCAQCPIKNYCATFQNK